MYYKALNGIEYVTEEYGDDLEYHLYTENDEEFTTADDEEFIAGDRLVCDWRELIY